MKHSIFIDGGAGRVVTSIPALEKFVDDHPEDEIRIICVGWEQLFWSNPKLQHLVIPVSQVGSWDYIKSSKRWMPEPYHHQGFIDGTHHLVDAFEELLEVKLTNKIPKLHVWSQERHKLQPLIETTRREAGKKNLIVFQPYGSGMKLEGMKPIDPSNRSLDVDQYLDIVKDLSRDNSVVFFGPKELEHPLDTYSIKVSHMMPDLRFWITLIEQSDYFIGVDSVGQHIARSLDIPGTVIMGATREQNVTYPTFNILRKPNRVPVYAPLRFPFPENEMADRANDGIMDFTPTEIQQIIENIRSHIKGM